MNSFENITSDDALLLAYAAGELDGEELRAFESRLSADSALREQAIMLRGDYQQTLHAMASLDQSYRVDERRSLQQIDRLMKQWQSEQEQIPAPIPLHRWRPPAWSYAVAASVALLVGFCFWWANNSPNQMAVVPSTDPANNVAVDDPNTGRTDPLPAVAVDPGPVQMPLAFQDVSSENSDRLANLEEDVMALSKDQLSANNSGDTNQ